MDAAVKFPLFTYWLLGSVVPGYVNNLTPLVIETITLLLLLSFMLDSGLAGQLICIISIFL